MPTSEEGRQRIVDGQRRRWASDPMGLDRYIEKLIARAPALTEEQRHRLSEMLADPRTGSGHLPEESVSC